MSWSAEARPQQRVLRDGASGYLPMASVVSPQGTIVLSRTTEPASTVESPGERLAAERRAGVEQGRADALADAQLALVLEQTESMRIAAASLQAACVTVTQNRRAIVDEVVADAVDLAFELLTLLVGDDLAQQRSPVRRAVERALALAPEGEDLRVRLHPDSDLGPAELEALASTGSAGTISLRADPSIEPTGCVVEAGACRIDAQIGPALERVRAALEQVRADHRRAEQP